MARVELSPQPTRTSANGLALIQRFETFLATPRKGSQGFLEIGWGHVLRPDEAQVTLVNRQQAEALLIEDLRVFEIYLQATIRVELAQHAFDALISLLRDVGIRAFERSDIRHLIQADKPQEAARTWRTWEGPRHGARNLERRHAEANLFLKASLSFYGHPEDEHFAAYLPE
ncbi:MAG TPA: lysozyme [Accumulibacter sp.]|uniref:lysozyme n=1 Tax=Accumulibacter sp. TaxID=2053492 RepID=UPI0025F83AC5|nr:lysozyme [Accumulibacter sp.]MCM8599944.1 lysozyme [Accumulibacter sp.]MCM8664128.1 lysozyme [Accumulibacter sp.]HNC51216.1 lysozyme [Accumulibacter sp.]